MSALHRSLARRRMNPPPADRARLHDLCPLGSDVDIPKGPTESRAETPSPRSQRHLAHRATLALLSIQLTDVSPWPSRLASNRGISRSASSSPVSASTCPRWRPSFCASHLGGAERHSRSGRSVPGIDQGLQQPRWKGSADDDRRHLRTPSQPDPPGPPEAIEDQQRSGGPPGNLSLVGGAFHMCFGDA